MQWGCCDVLLQYFFSPFVFFLNCCEISYICHVQKLDWTSFGIIFITIIFYWSDVVTLRKRNEKLKLEFWVLLSLHPLGGRFMQTGSRSSSIMTLWEQSSRVLITQTLPWLSVSYVTMVDKVFLVVDIIISLKEVK